MLHHLRRSFKILHRTTYSCTSLYNQVNEGDINFFISILDKSSVLQDDIESFNTDWTGHFKGRSRVVLKPSSADEISQILKYCNTRRLPVVPQGGNTSIMGAAVPFHGEVIISFQRMDQVIHFDGNHGIVHAQPGLILQNLQDFLHPRGFTIGHDLGSKGSCTLGGNLGTNVGGLRVIRYGHFKNSVLGLKVVLSNGTILDDITSMKKNNTGYHLKDLFIGSEGTLGVITDIAFTAPPRPLFYNTAMLAFRTFEDLAAACKEAKHRLGEIIYAIEFLNGFVLKTVVETLQMANPFHDLHPYYLIVQTAGMNEHHDREKTESFLDAIFDRCADGVIAESESQQAAIFALRENAYVGITALGLYEIGYDVSLDINTIPEFEQRLHDRLTGFEYQFATFAHIGDNDFHFHIITPERNAELEAALMPYILEVVRDLGGSISAETGIGVLQRPYMGYARKQPVIDTMMLLKKTLDPRLILNPDKLFLVKDLVNLPRDITEKQPQCDHQ